MRISDWSSDVCSSDLIGIEAWPHWNLSKHDEAECSYWNCGDDPNRPPTQIGDPASGHPTLPSRLIPSNFCASTANSIGSCCNTSFAKDRKSTRLNSSH